MTADPAPPDRDEAGREPEDGTDPRQPFPPLAWLEQLAHDLKNPLSALRLRAELQLPPGRCAAWMADLDDAERAIDQSLRFARGLSVAPRREPGPSQALGELLARLQGDRELGPWQWRLDDDALAGLPVPATAVRLAVHNLLHNAHRHGRPPVVLRVSLADGRCQLRVSDAGPGLSAAQLDAHLAAAARRAAGRAPGRGLGGLGLALVQQAAQALGGDLLHEPVTPRENPPFDGWTWAIGLRWPVAHDPR